MSVNLQGFMSKKEEDLSQAQASLHAILAAQDAAEDASENKQNKQLKAVAKQVHSRSY